jgi:hypothetical protein
MPTTYAARKNLRLNPDHEPLDWGPAKHDPEHPLHPRAQALDLRDAAGDRPDDN